MTLNIVELPSNNGPVNLATLKHAGSRHNLRKQNLSFARRDGKRKDGSLYEFD